MTGIEAIGAIAGGPPVLPTTTVGAAAAPVVPAGDFGTLLQRGLASMEAKVADADRMVARFALDDDVPVHQVTIALEEARLSVEFAMQVRQRLVESYRELMNMQL